MFMVICSVQLGFKRNMSAVRPACPVSTGMWRMTKQCPLPTACLIPRSPRQCERHVCSPNEQRLIKPRNANICTGCCAFGSRAVITVMLKC